MMPIINFGFSVRIWLMILASISLPALLGAGFSSLKKAYYTRHYKTYKDKMKNFHSYYFSSKLWLFRWFRNGFFILKRLW